MLETLRVDAPLVQQAGASLETIAGAIPPPPTVSAPSGSDPLSTAITAKIAEVVDPVLAQMPIVKQALDSYAQKVKAAASAYERTERQIIEDIRERIAEFDALFNKCQPDAPGAPAGPAAPGGGSPSPPSTGGGGSTGGGSSASSGPTSSAAGDVSATAPSGTVSQPPAAQSAGSMGQMMQMPMQVAQQTAQIPTQLLGIAGVVPQAAAQTVQTVMQSVGQGSDAASSDDEAPAADETTSATPADEAAPGSPGGERAPDGKQPGASSDSQSVPQKRGEASPEIAL